MGRFCFHVPVFQGQIHLFTYPFAGKQHQIYIFPTYNQKIANITEDSKDSSKKSEMKISFLEQKTVSRGIKKEI